MCAKLQLRNLNPIPFFLHPTRIYICEITITLKMCGGFSYSLLWQYWILGNCYNHPQRSEEFSPNWGRDSQWCILRFSIMGFKWFSRIWCRTWMLRPAIFCLQAGLSLLDSLHFFGTDVHNMITPFYWPFYSYCVHVHISHFNRFLKDMHNWWSHECFLI